MHPVPLLREVRIRRHRRPANRARRAGSWDRSAALAPGGTRRRRLAGSLLALAILASGCGTGADTAGPHPATPPGSPGGGAPGAPAQARPSSRPPPPAAVRLYEDITARSGIDFHHHQQKGVELRYVPETMGAGCGVVDYDRDGHWDVFFVQGTGSPVTGTTTPTCRLYRGRGDGTFEDATVRARLDVSLWGMGCLWFDYDDDGLPDLFLTAYGEPNRLFHHEADHTFRDVTGPAGLDGGAANRWSTGATALDFDGDGDLDLYVCGYLDFEPSDFIENPKLETIYNSGENQPATFSPFSFDPLPNRLYRNEGNGTFLDVTGVAGVANPEGKGLSALAADFDADGGTDLFVANDVTEKCLLSNQGDGTFVDIARKAWVADIRGSMGLASADVDEDGALDVFSTHWISEPNALYRNNFKVAHNVLTKAVPGKRLTFSEISEFSGLGPPSVSFVGWGCALTDLDLDGRPDVVLVNGHTFLDHGTPRKLIAQEGMVFFNRGGKRFERADLDRDDGLEVPRVARGLAIADFDEDGFPDLVITQNNGPAAVLRHRGLPGVRSLRVTLEGTTSARDAVGALVRVTAGGRVQTLSRVSGDSYLSSTWPALLFGIGASAGVDRIEVQWPSGLVESFPVAGASAPIHLVEGKGSPVGS